MSKGPIARLVSWRHARLLSHGEGDLAMLANAGSLTSAMAINAGLGFVYWWLAARLFAPAAVGLASAAVSAMMLLGNAGMLGLGTLLLGELPRRPGREGELVTVGLVVSALAGFVLGVILPLLPPLRSGDLGLLSSSAGSVALFGLGTGMTAAALVMDQALIGLSRGIVQLRRSVTFAVAKLVMLLVIGLWAGNGSGLTIYATWVAGILLSFVAIIRSFPSAKLTGVSPARAWALVRTLGRSAAAHHSLNLVLQAPGLMLPLIVTAVISAEANSGFYIAWMVAGIVFVAPDSLATVLYSSSSAHPAEVSRRLVRLGLLSLAWGVVANIGLLLVGGPMLRLFGGSYAATGTTSLRLLALAVFPLVVRFFFVVVRRIQGRVASTAALMTAGSLIEVAAATAGAYRAGLSGLCIGWVLALCVQALLMGPTLLRAMRQGVTPAELL